MRFERMRKLSYLFVNYYSNSNRPSPINLGIVRVLLGTYLIWRVSTFNWAGVQEWPYPRNKRFDVFHHELLLTVLPYQKWIVIVALALFVVGFKTRWSGVVASLLLMQMLTVTATIYLAGTTESLMVCSFFVLFIALFHEDDCLSIDGFLRTKQTSLSELNESLKGRTNQTYQIRPLKWGLVVIGLMYFGSAWGKIKSGPLSIWASGADLQRTFLRFQEITGNTRPVAEFISQTPELAFLGHVGVAVLQLSFIFAVILGFTITPIALGLIGFHIASIFTLGLYFIDMILLLSLYLAWDRGYGYLVTDRKIDLIYDEHCYFCVRSLYQLKILDINDTVSWYPQNDAPARYSKRADVDFDKEICVFVDNEAFHGYYAFQQLLKQFWFTLPVAWIMSLPPVATAGKRIYEYIAENQDRYFVCSYESSEQ